MKYLPLWLGIIAGFIFTALEKAHSHDIYTNVRGKNGQLCCGGDDCSSTIYRLDKGEYEFKTREGVWVTIPQDRITFLPIPGEAPDVVNYAHICYRKSTQYDTQNVFGPIFLYCAFIPPGAT
jgi:hypothetical protein